MLKKVTNQNRFSRECSAPGTIVDYMKTFIQVEFHCDSNAVSLLYCGRIRNFNRIQSQKRTSQSNEACAIFLTNLIHLCEAIIQFACLFDGVARRYSFHMYGVVVGI